MVLKSFKIKRCELHTNEAQHSKAYLVKFTSCTFLVPKPGDPTYPAPVETPHATLSTNFI
jgi:hypothetical protein